MSLRLLCDVGNTNFSFSNGKSVPVDEFDPGIVDGQVYFVSVNDYWEKRLDTEAQWINLRQLVDFTQYYESMGIDRIMTCEAVEDALIIDAGSAITVDLVKQGRHQGGFIYPGLDAMQKCFKNISPRLDVSFNFELDLATMPKNTIDALSYGALAPLISHICSLAGNLPVLLTGGDAQTLSPFLPQAEIDRLLVFKGMEKIIEGKA